MTTPSKACLLCLTGDRVTSPRSPTPASAPRSGAAAVIPPVAARALQHLPSNDRPPSCPLSQATILVTWQPPRDVPMDHLAASQEAVKRNSMQGEFNALIQTSVGRRGWVLKQMMQIETNSPGFLSLQSDGLLALDWCLEQIDKNQPQFQQILRRSNPQIVATWMVDGLNQAGRDFRISVPHREQFLQELTGALLIHQSMIKLPPKKPKQELLEYREFCRKYIRETIENDPSCPKMTPCMQKAQDKEIAKQLEPWIRRHFRAWLTNQTLDYRHTNRGQWVQAQTYAANFAQEIAISGSLCGIGLDAAPRQAIAKQFVNAITGAAGIKGIRQLDQNALNAIENAIIRGYRSYERPLHLKQEFSSFSADSIPSCLEKLREKLQKTEVSFYLWDSGSEATRALVEIWNEIEKKLPEEIKQECKQGLQEIYLDLSSERACSETLRTFPEMEKYDSSERIFQHLFKLLHHERRERGFYQKLREFQQVIHQSYEKLARKMAEMRPGLCLVEQGERDRQFRRAIHQTIERGCQTAFPWCFGTSCNPERWNESHDFDPYFSTELKKLQMHFEDLTLPLFEGSTVQEGIEWCNQLSFYELLKEGLLSQEKQGNEFPWYEKALVHSMRDVVEGCSLPICPEKLEEDLFAYAELEINEALQRQRRLDQFTKELNLFWDHYEKTIRKQGVLSEERIPPLLEDWRAWNPIQSFLQEEWKNGAAGSRSVLSGITQAFRSLKKQYSENELDQIFTHQWTVQKDFWTQRYGDCISSFINALESVSRQDFHVKALQIYGKR